MGVEGLGFGGGGVGGFSVRVHEFMVDGWGLSDSGESCLEYVSNIMFLYRVL